MHILIVDDDPSVSQAYELCLKDAGHTTETCLQGTGLLKLLDNSDFDLVILDIKMPDINTGPMIRQIRERKQLIDIILITSEKKIIDAVNSMDLGIYDIMHKPVNFVQLIKKLKSLEKERQTVPFSSVALHGFDREILLLKDLEGLFEHSVYNSEAGPIGIFSEQMRIIFNKLKKIRDYPRLPVLIEGETGTGKELAAKYIHYQEINKNENFIAVNCSTFQPDLFEAELFGYEKGSFTGADPEGKSGYIQAAGSGTLFLDEISEIPIGLQAKLLRVLQEREYIKLGSHTRRKVECRIICASNKNLKALTENESFRHDLYYRLNVCPVAIPPLRERKEAIIPLSIMFTRKYNQEFSGKVQGIEKKALDLLTEYPWPGNIRELENLITKILLFHDDTILRIQHFTTQLQLNNNPEEQKTEVSLINDFEIPDDPFSLDDFMKEIVRKTLNKFNGNKTKTAQHLGLSLSQMYRRYKTD